MDYKEKEKTTPLKREKQQEITITLECTLVPQNDGTMLVVIKPVLPKKEIRLMITEKNLVILHPKLQIH